MATNAERLAQAYADAEAWILHLIAQAVKRGATGTANVYGERLTELQGLIREVQLALDQLDANALAEVGGALMDAWEEGVQQAIVTIPAEPAVPSGSITTLALETAGALRSQRQSILRSVEDGYRQVIREVSIRQAASGMNIDTAMQQALDKFAARGIVSFVDNGGRRWNMDTYARMALRTAANRAHNEARARSFEANDIDLILVSWHRACSPMCLPYQGRILSISGGPGEHTAWDRTTGDITTVTVTENRATAIRNGFLHPHCRHTESAYIPGMPVPEVPDVGEEEHEELQRQRAIERHIRHWKRREAVAMDPRAQNQAKAKIRAWQAEQRKHVKKHWFLRRNYSREQVRTGNPADAR